MMVTQVYTYIQTYHDRNDTCLYLHTLLYLLYALIWGWGIPGTEPRFSGMLSEQSVFESHIQNSFYSLF